MGLGSLIGALDELAVEDPSALADPDTIVELHRQLARLEAITTRAVGSFDARKEWAADRARSAANWIAFGCGLPVRAAWRRVRLARSLRNLPGSERAWLAGDLTGAHVNQLARVRNEQTAEAMDRDEDLLVSQAKSLPFGALYRAVAYWRQRADPNGAEADQADKEEARSLHLSRTFQDMWALDGLLDPIGGTVLADELKRLDQILFSADWAEAKERLGREPTVIDLRRTPAQRRADALVEMATRSRTAPADGRRPEPLFTVLVGFETLAGPVCELASGIVVSPGALVKWLLQAWIERIVFDSPSRVIDVGVTQRLFTGATRRAIEVRDRECFHEFCDLTADDCQVDHIQPYSADGPTIQANGRLACGFHNRDRHRAREGDDP